MASVNFKRYLIIIFCQLLVAGFIPAMAEEAMDDDGTRIVLPEPAHRIISLAPSLTEILFAAGAGDHIVGVVEYSDYPPAARNIPVVGRHDLLDLETIVALQPDLIVSWRSGNPQAAVARLRQLGYPVYVAEPRHLASIPDHLERLATLAGTMSEAIHEIEEFNRILEQLENNYSEQSPVRVFYQVWDAPLITAGGNELIHDIITLCGGRNIFADLSLVAPKVSRESVLARNPDVIIASGMDVARPEWLDAWLNWPSLYAVANEQLYFIPPDLVQRHTPRALSGAQQMCRQIDQARSILAVGQ